MNRSLFVSFTLCLLFGSYSAFAGVILTAGEQSLFSFETFDRNINVQVPPETNNTYLRDSRFPELGDFNAGARADTAANYADLAASIDAAASRLSGGTPLDFVLAAVYFRDGHVGVPPDPLDPGETLRFEFFEDGAVGLPFFDTILSSSAFKSNTSQGYGGLVSPKFDGSHWQDGTGTIRVSVVSGSVEIFSVNAIYADNSEPATMPRPGVTAQTSFTNFAQTVPEPSTGLFGVIGILAVALRRIRNGRNA